MQRLSLVFSIAIATAGCGGTDMVGTSTLVAGTYRADQLLVTPTGQTPIDVLAAGGSLSITIEASGATSGSLYVPPTIGGVPFGVSMVGTATVTATTVQFTQSADTFVRDLTWTRSANRLEVTDQQAGGASYTISLVKQ
jgi:hypothetical protein